MSGSPISRVVHYRHRTDAGSVDDVPTWAAAENTSASLTVGTNYRTRVSVENTGTGADTILTPQFSRCGYANRAWSSIDGAIFSVADAGSSADGANVTVQRLSNGTGSFATGTAGYDENRSLSCNVNNGNFTEVEWGWVFVGGAGTPGVGGGELWTAAVQGLTNAAANTPTWTTPEATGSDFQPGNQLGGNAQLSANAASISMTTAAGASAGDLVVVTVACDNNATGDGDTGEVSGVTINGETATKAVEFTNGQGAAQAGTTASIWYKQLAGAMSAGATITATFTTATTSGDANAIQARAFTVASGKTVSVEASNGVADDGSATVSSLDATTSNIECLRVRATATENALSNVLNAFEDLKATNRDWSLWWSGGALARGVTGCTLFTEATISTGTGRASQPVARAIASDRASAYVAFKATAPQVPVSGVGGGFGAFGELAWGEIEYVIEEEAVLKDVSDELGLTLAEQVSIFAAISRSDELALAVSEDVTIFAALARADAIGVSIDEVATILATLSRSDTLNLTVAEQAAVAVIASVSETLGIDLSDTASVDALLDRVDSLGLSLSEVASILVRATRSDAISVAINDVADLLNFVSVVDALGADITEVSDVAIGGVIEVMASDALNISASEVATIAAIISVMDTLSVSVSETSDLVAFLTRTDELGLTLEEVALVLVSVSRSDALAVAVNDMADLTNLVNVLDALNVTIGEVSDVVIAGVVEVMASDTLNVLASEAATVAALITAIDALNISVTEQAEIVGFLSRTDELGLSLAETVAILSRLDRADLLHVTLNDVASLFAVLSAFDALSVSLDDQGSLEVTADVILKAVSDTISLTLEEATTLAVLLTRQDIANVSLNETVAIFAMLDVAEQLGVSVAEMAAILASLTTSDIVGVTAGDAGSVANVLSAADSLGISISESSLLEMELVLRRRRRIKLCGSRATDDVLPGDRSRWILRGSRANPKLKGET